MKPYSNPAVTTNQTTRKKSIFLSFSCGGIQWALPTSTIITHTKTLQTLSPVNDRKTPYYLLGTTQINKSLIPVIDGHLKFGVIPVSYSEEIALLIVKIEELSIALKVDSIEGEISLMSDQITHIPKNDTALYKGVFKKKGQSLLIINEKGFFHSDELMQLKKILAKHKPLAPVPL